MGNLAELQKEFMKGLGQRLEPLSLKYSATHQDYSRNFDLGKQSFHISFVNLQSRFAVVADIGIRFDDVEIIRMFNMPVYLVAKNVTPTLSALNSETS